MINVTFSNEPEYISPSTFLVANSCELAVYFAKWAGLNIPRPQTIQMAVGSAFDAFIKAEISKALGKEIKLNDLLDNVGIKEAIAHGKQLADLYIKNKCLQRLLDSGLTDIEFSYKKVDRFGVPIYGILDAHLEFEGTLVPVDFKVNGFGSNYGGSIHRGYCRRINSGFDKGPDPKGPVPLEQVAADWAIQLIFYWWMLNKEQTNRGDSLVLPVRGIIEQIKITPNNIEFVTYDAEASMDFVLDLKMKLQTFWSRLKKGELKDPTPCTAVCEPYNNPRPCTAFCPYYATWKEKPTSDNIIDKVLER